VTVVSDHIQTSEIDSPYDTWRVGALTTNISAIHSTLSHV